MAHMVMAVALYILVVSSSSREVPPIIVGACGIGGWDPPIIVGASGRDGWDPQIMVSACGKCAWDAVRLDVVGCQRRDGSPPTKEK